MKIYRSITLVVALASPLIAFSFSDLSAVAEPSYQSASDNSRQNQQQQTTADNQSNSNSDRHTTAQIRRAIIGDKGLSTYAHKVKIVTANGQVTLKGPVSSEEEKQKVASDAASVVSADKVTNELTVKH
jgi:osmotically-inducible protein OsmY